MKAWTYTNADAYDEKHQRRCCPRCGFWPGSAGSRMFHKLCIVERADGSCDR